MSYLRSKVPENMERVAQASPSLKKMKPDDVGQILVPDSRVQMEELDVAVNGQLIALNMAGYAAQKRHW